MAKTIRFHPKVAVDIQSAASWYDVISRTLGARFRNAVKTRIAAVKSRPESFGRIHDERRAAPIKGFPYFILFLPRAEHVIFIGVLHTASDPSKWSERTVE
jgi:hypothetical protein